MATKKEPIKKPTINKKTVKKAVNEVKKTVKAEADEIVKETKVMGTKVGSRRHNASTEEKVYTILGIILLGRGVYALKQLIRGGVLIVIGILFVTGFFIKKNK